ncbi:membrane protein [Photobacterium gaetbulicola]|uniref:Membrane protein n=1 Tax=Photobacterium gaetbulicola TaxID=1295392 RepID=A0A0B9GHU3_9GAMM|nr:membrane protein [Photobacterium gaetbulicola]
MIVTNIIIWSGLDPALPDVWLAEIIPVVLILAPLLITYRFFRFSNTAYILIAIWMSLHTIGAHYTFANVPFDWFNDLIGSQRNNFDRLAHFSIGLYAFPIAEFLVRKQVCKPFWASVFALVTIMAIAASYEIIEWWYAVLAGGEAGVEFLGSQGDIWDAQKDMLADTLGAITSLVIFHIIKPYQPAHNTNQQAW